MGLNKLVMGLQKRSGGGADRFERCFLGFLFRVRRIPRRVESEDDAEHNHGPDADNPA